ncbi:MAG: zinc-binding dehydrogenase [Gaiellaceae bacterium]
MTAPAISRATMRAATLAAPGVARVDEAPVPEPRAGEVLVRIEGCGVCASSLPLWQGREWFDYPLEPGEPGHEAWGTEVESGRRVALLHEQGFREFAAVPRELVVPLPDALADAPFPGEALGCAMNIFSRADVHAGQTVGIVGVGFLGALLVQLCAGAGARVLAFSRRPFALELARAFGAETPSARENESCDVVIESAGVQETLDLASQLCRVRGRLVIAGFHQDGPRTVDVQLWNWRGLDVVNAHERDPAIVLEGIRAAARAVADGQLDPEPLYTHVLPLEQLGQAFTLAADRPDGFVKALVTT